MLSRFGKRWALWLAGGALALAIVPGMVRAAPTCALPHLAPHDVTNTGQLAFDYPSYLDVVARSGNAVLDLASLDMPRGVQTAWSEFHKTAYINSGALGAYQQAAAIRVIDKPKQICLTTQTCMQYGTEFLGTYYPTAARAKAWYDDAIAEIQDTSSTGLGLTAAPCSTYYFTIAGYGPYTLASNNATCQFTAFHAIYKSLDVEEVYAVFYSGNAVGEIQFQPPINSLSAGDDQSTYFRNEIAQEILDISAAAENHINQVGGGATTTTSVTPTATSVTATPTATSTATATPTATNTRVPPPAQPLVHVSGLKVLEGPSSGKQKETKTLHSGKAATIEAEIQYQNQGSFTPSVSLTLAPQGKVTGTSNIAKTETKGMNQLPSFSPNTWLFGDNEKFKVTHKEKVKADVRVTLGPATDEAVLTFTICPKGKTTC